MTEFLSVFRFTSRARPLLFPSGISERKLAEIARLRRDSWVNSLFIEITSRIAAQFSWTNFLNWNKCLPILSYLPLSLLSCQVNCLFLECLCTRLVFVTLCTKVFPCTILFFISRREEKQHSSTQGAHCCACLCSRQLHLLYAFIRFSYTLSIIQNLLVL